MGIFDNAKSIVIGDKEVKSIEVDGGVIWESEPPAPVLRNITVSCGGNYDESYITLDGSVTRTANHYGVVTFSDVSDGVHELTAYDVQSNPVKCSISVDETHTSFDVSEDWTPYTVEE